MNKAIKKIVKKTGRSFFWGVHVLPTKERRAFYTLYAFCRHIDDIVTGEYPISKKVELINAWKKEIDNIYDKKVPVSDIGRNIYKNCMRFNLPKNDLVNIVDSVSMDLPTPLHSPNLSELTKYCSGVACSPCSLSLRILGCKDDKLINELASSLGMAIQLTTILRDIRDDASSDRLYIPNEFLQKAGITSKDPATVVIDKNLAIAREELAKIANENYAKSYQLIKRLDKKIARNINAIVYIYKRYFDIMQNRGWEIISPKPRINKLTKLLLIAKAFLGK